jgi:predicted amidohydrolase
VQHLPSLWLGRNWFARYYDNAIAIPSQEFDELSRIAKDNSVFLQVGIVEKSGATLYCATTLFGRDGSLLSHHRKVSEASAIHVS